MAYVYSSTTAATEAAATSLVVALPAHAANDVIFVFVCQDTGTGTLSISSGGTYTEVTTQAAANAQRTAAFYKVAASSSEGPITVSSTLSDDIHVVVAVVRGANTTTPVHMSARTDTAASTLAPQPAAMTTTVNDCLMLYALGFDNSFNYLWAHAGEADCVGKVNFGACIAVGSKPHRTAGAAPRPIFRADVTGEGGTWITVAVNDSGGGVFAPTCASGPSVVWRFTDDGNGYDAITYQTLTSVPPATIGGVTLRNASLIKATAQPIDTRVAWGTYFGFGDTTTAPGAGGEYVGTSFATSQNFDGKTIGLSWALSSYTATTFAGDTIAVFCDASNNWEAHRIAPTAPGSIVSGSASAQVPVWQTVIKPSDNTPLASGGTLDWSAVTRVGLCFHKAEGATTSRYPIIQNWTTVAPTVLVGGSPGHPLNWEFVEQALDGWLANDYIDLQGRRQILLKVPVTFGNGSTPTYLDWTGAAVDTPARGVTPAGRLLWDLPDDDLVLRIKAGASDTIYARNAVLRTETQQLFTIDSTSSASADYDFSGLVLLRWKVSHNASGVTMNGATFAGCRGVTLNGGSLDGCTIDAPLTSPGVTTNDPSKISNCSFISAGTGHAIEITSPGTYTFTGNTFSGYGSTGTTDAAIYNNSGGAVTLNITGGGDTPTYRNGTSASTTVNNNITITLDNLVVGSNIRVEKTSDGSLVEFRTADATQEVFTVAASIGHTIKVRKGSASTYYKPYETQVAAATTDQSVYVSQITD